MIDILAAAGLDRPELGTLSEELLAEVLALSQKYLSADTLRRLLEDAVKVRRRPNVVQARGYAELLERANHAYRNRASDTIAFIEELIELAREMRAADQCGGGLGLNVEEIAFYDALGTYDSAVRALGDETLRGLSVEPVETVRRNVTIDWTQRESACPRLRVQIKRAFRRHGYPPGQAGSRHPHCARAGGGVVCGLGGIAAGPPCAEHVPPSQGTVDARRNPRHWTRPLSS